MKFTFRGVTQRSSWETTCRVEQRSEPNKPPFKLPAIIDQQTIRQLLKAIRINPHKFFVCKFIFVKIDGETKLAIGLGQDRHYKIAEQTGLIRYHDRNKEGIEFSAAYIHFLFIKQTNQLEITLGNQSKDFKRPNDDQFRALANYLGGLLESNGARNIQIEEKYNFASPMDFLNMVITAKLPPF